MSNFLNYWNKLRQHVPSLSPEQAQDYINIAWRSILQANDEWTFLYDQEYWLAPGAIQFTDLGVTQFSDEVELGFASLALVGAVSVPPITLYQLRFGLSGGPIYSIESTDVLQVTDGQIMASDTTLQCLTSAPFASSDVGKLIIVEGAGVAGADLQTTIASFTSTDTVELTDAASTTVSNATVTFGSILTLDRLFNEGTNAAASAQCYRIYYSPLSTDFDRLDHLVDPIMGYEWGWEIRDRDELDRIDPQRSAQGQPYRLYYYRFNNDTGLPEYEMWPGPTAQRAYTASLWRQGLDFTEDTDALPPRIPEKLLLLRARLEAYEWGAVSDPDPARRRSFENGLGYIRSRYSTEGDPRRPLGELDDALRRDRSIYLKQFKRRPRNPGPGWPIGDSRFAQSHDIGTLGGPYY